ncbi:L,D-transpeptidase [Jiella sp. M17.18]|uniref:L,D-transpeptidase n=1 Tax=Jiella sp. M17.18 TaxID=3234247 RepID=UPI0034DECBE1
MTISTRLGALCAAALFALSLGGPAAAEPALNHRPAHAARTAAPRTQAELQALLNRRPAARFERAEVRISTGEPAGTIIVDSQKKYLYFVEGGGRATRYGVGVGREGFGWSGLMKVGRKAEWPGWTPPKQMIARERRNGHIIPAYMPGGPGNPLGARAMYLYHGGNDSLFRIHGTNQPWTIGHEMSSGCIRMMNQDVEHLYSRVAVGTKVIVIGPDGSGPKGVYADLGPVRRNFFDVLFGR